MPNLTIHNMPEDIHKRLRLYASEHNCTTSEVVIMALQRELERWEWKKRLAQRPKTNLSIPSTDLIAEERSSRTQKLANC
jgi:plasmid stability protein